MKHRGRYILALTLVATTLCAGRLFASGQTDPGESKTTTEKLAARLTRSFSQTVSRSPLVVQRQMALPVDQPLRITAKACGHAAPLSPLQSNLPPPLV